MTAQASETDTSMEQPRVKPGRYFDSGNVAVAEGAIFAGVEGYFGYPITPSSSIMEHIVKRFEQITPPGEFLQCEDEIASIIATIGFSWTRKKSMTTTSGPGFSLMQEGIGLAAMTETPLVLVNVMRGGPSTGLPTYPGQQELMQAHFGSHGDYLIPTLAPANVQEAFDLTVEAFNISEALRTPAFVLSDQVLSALKERYIVPEPEKIEIVKRARPGHPIKWKGEEISTTLVPPMKCFGEGERVYNTGLAHDETGHVNLTADTYETLLTRLREKITTYEHLMPRPELYETEDAKLIVVAYGTNARSAKLAVKHARKKGLKVGLMRLRTIWPFPVNDLQDVASDKEVLVTELSQGQLIWPVERYLHKEVHHFPYIRGEIALPRLILERIEKIL